MKTKLRMICGGVLILAGLLGLTAAVPENGGGDKLTVPLSDPSRPAHLRVGLINGSISVEAYSGKDVEVEAVRREGDDSDEDNDADQDAAAKRSGLRKITNTSTGLSVDENNNEVEVSTGLAGASGTIDLKIRVPVSTSVKLSTINDGDIRVTGVKGECEVSNTNGSVTLSKISGSAVVDALNGEINVGFLSVDPGKPMSFSSMNGDIDVTFPPDIHATVKMKSEQGDIYSDFDIKMTSPSSRVVENQTGNPGKFKVAMEKMMSGSINGGGSEIVLKNFNGSIYIRKGK
ncbi:MAG TPA: DUF4097 family beta strand repeat-containing protein [Bacteroidota bacterium]|nr:DUF4097 family beta strand repeat-containing protein [Bacteroidota bacterium]